MGTTKQLFLDDSIAAHWEFVTREFHQPVKFAGNPIIKRDRAWDAARCDMYGSVVYDPERDRLQLYYSAVSLPEKHDDRLGYAESYDGGATWQKPNVNLVSFNGSTQNNLVLGPISEYLAGPCVFRDEHASDTNKRYKLFTCAYYYGMSYKDVDGFYRVDWSVAPPAGMGQAGMYAGTSPDGIHWTVSDEPFSNLISDTAQCAFWDERLHRYVAYVRGRVHEARAVGRMESRDFVTWTEPEIVMSETPELYSMGVMPYAGLYIGTPWMCWDLGPSASGRVISPELALSRDGVAWQRCNPGTEFIPCGPADSADALQIRMASSFVVLKDKLLFFYGQTDKAHVAEMCPDIGMAALRLDGFASMNAGSEVGTLSTFPLEYPGEKSLKVNFQTEDDGYMEVQLWDAATLGVEGQPTVRLAESEPMRGDHTALNVSWQGDGDLGRFAGKRVIIGFRMKNCKLYAFEFIDRFSQ